MFKTIFTLIVSSRYIVIKISANIAHDSVSINRGICCMTESNRHKCVVDVWFTDFFLLMMMSFLKSAIELLHFEV